MVDTQDRVRIRFVTLDCGHSINPDAGVGVCMKCRGVNCGKCVQTIDSKLFCHECFTKYMRSKGE